MVSLLPSFTSTTKEYRASSKPVICQCLAQYWQAVMALLLGYNWHNSAPVANTVWLPTFPPGRLFTENVNISANENSPFIIVLAYNILLVKVYIFIKFLTITNWNIIGLILQLYVYWYVNLWLEKDFRMKPKRIMQKICNLAWGTFGLISAKEFQIGSQVAARRVFVCFWKPPSESNFSDEKIKEEIVSTYLIIE